MTSTVWILLPVLTPVSIMLAALSLQRWEDLLLQWRHHNRQAGRHPRGRDQPNSGDEPASTSPTSLGNGRNATTARLHAVPSAAPRTDDRRGAVPPRAVLRRRTAGHRAMTSSRGSPATTAIEDVRLTHDQRHRAVRTVASRSNDAADCALLLAILGLDPVDGLTSDDPRPPRRHH